MDLYQQLPESQLLYEDEYTAFLDACARFQVDTLQILNLTPAELSKTLFRSVTEIKAFQDALRQEFVYEIKTSKQPDGFSTGDGNIDSMLGGIGIHSGQVTEIFGESSTGKTQFLLQLALMSQVDGGKCVYITTEGDLPTRRLEEMSSHRPGTSQDNIYYVSCPDLDNQEHILDVQLSVLLERDPAIKLIVIDSIAHHLRVDLFGTGFAHNKQYLDALGRKLRLMALKFNTAVVVANQVSDRPLKSNSTLEVQDYDYQFGWLCGWDDASISYRHNYDEEEEFSQRPEKKRKVVPKVATKYPTLGLSWTNYLNTRILLSKRYSADTGLETLWRCHRTMQVVFSTQAPARKVVEFEIFEGGIRSITHI